MAEFDIVILSTKDGTWDAFREDWEAQCKKVGETFEDYSPDSLSVVSGIAAGAINGVAGDGETKAGALIDRETNTYYACCVLNRARLPGTDGRTLRVRHLQVSPLLDYGIADVKMYPDVVIGVMLGIIKLAETVLEAEHILFHLRSPEDMDFFRTFGIALNGANIFESVQTRGSWLYITKPAAPSGVDSEEA